MIKKYFDAQFAAGDPYNGFSQLYDNHSIFMDFLKDLQNMIPLFGSKNDKNDQFIKGQLIFPLIQPTYESIPTYKKVVSAYNSYFGLVLKISYHDPIICQYCHKEFASHSNVKRYAFCSTKTRTIQITTCSIKKHKNTMISLCLSLSQRLITVFFCEDI